MKWLTVILVLVALLVMAQTCQETTVNNKPSLSLQLVQVNTNVNFNFQNGLVLAGGAPIDVNSANWSWLKTNTVQNGVMEGQEFGARFYLDYPIGNPSIDNVILELITSSKKIPQVGIISSGNIFIEQKKGTIRDEEENIYRYKFGLLKEGTKQTIILGGRVGAIGFSNDDTTPIAVRLLKDNEEEIIGNQVNIKIIANVN